MVRLLVGGREEEVCVIDERVNVRYFTGQAEKRTLMLAEEVEDRRTRVVRLGERV
jgi:hypothetical protein